MRFEKVVLVVLPSPWLISDRDVPPLGVLYLAASLKLAGIAVQVCDLAGLPEERWRIPRADLYGISLTTPQFPYAKRVIDKLRNRGDGTIVAGGPHVSALPKHSFVDLGLDYGFIGEADLALPSFILGRAPEEVEGLVYRAAGGLTVNPLPAVDVSSLPLPARGLIDIASYQSIGTNRYVERNARREGYVLTGRGCPYRCAFCGQRAVTGGRVRQRPIASVIPEVYELLTRYSCDLIYFEDDTFNLSRPRVLELCRAFRRLDFCWHCLCRPDRVDAGMLQAMHDAGCRNVTFGFESGSNFILQRMQKGVGVEDSLHAAELVDRAGMTVRGQMIVGFPGETDETIRETEGFIRSAPVAKWGFHAFVPLPGSPVWDEPEKYGLVLDKRSLDFSAGFHTIGRPQEWLKILAPNEAKVRVWLKHLISVAKERNIFEGME